MDFTDTTKIVLNRIKKLDPENATKIIGYLLLQGAGDQQMTQLAMSPEIFIQDIIYKAKADLHRLQQLAHNSASTPISPSVNSPLIPKVSSQAAPFSSMVFPSPANFGVSSPYWEPQLSANHNSDVIPLNYSDSIHELQSQTQFLSLEDQFEHANGGNTGFPNDYYYLDAALSSQGGRMDPRYQSIAEVPVKTCHYFNKGYCKHGSNCRYFHGQMSEGFHQMVGHNSFDANEDQVFSPGSFEKLEMEIIKLLKSRRGNKYQERIEHPMYHSSHYIDMDTELHSVPRGCETSRLLRKQFIEDHEAFELQRRRLAELSFMQKPLANQSFFGYMDGSEVSEEHLNFPSPKHFSELLDVLNSNDRIRHINTNYSDPDSEGLNLPDSPFASPVVSSISAVI
ncbi:zinc finger CCCH domain-containing protein 18-like [Carica papaya]|uniref:zinc finger CCCH domain-containing protein 18-like n=1 Tax=Carica papaya TaxID=3649 RepID=UPI000B8D0CBB|nr:zinc finger CCCH domain-containing protein 18-like [Carica papaya]